MGKYLFECWDEIEKKLTPEAKLSLICEKLTLYKDHGVPPYQTVKGLMQFRNDVVHGKTETLSAETIYEGDPEAFLEKRLQTRWQRYCTPENARKVFVDIDRIIGEIHEHSKMKDSIFMAGIWGHVVEPLLDESAQR